MEVKFVQGSRLEIRRPTVRHAHGAQH
jgi:hypothetical protein